MNLSVCTISFRHQLMSVEQIAQWASLHQFCGIELWGVHAQNLLAHPEYTIDWLRARHGLSVPMLSDYLPIQGDRSVAIDRTSRLCRMTRDWGATKLRTFAGNKGSREVSAEERRAWIARLRELCDVAEAHGIFLVVETHPGTLADTQASTLQLVEELDHRALRFNFDVIHVWEGGSDPAEVFRVLEPLIAHMHLKNIASPELLSVFAPANVYAPAGIRTGMVPLFEGAFDYQQFMPIVMAKSRLWETLDVSLEWFGPNVLSTLEHDSRALLELESRHLRTPPVAVTPAASPLPITSNV